MDEAKIKDVHYKEVEELLKKHVSGVKRYHIFDHTIRWVKHHYPLVDAVAD